MDVPPDFFTVGSFSTLVGLTGITFVITSTARTAFNFEKNWFGLFVAIAATEMGVFLSQHNQAGDFVLGFLNGCLVFLTAAGSSQAISHSRGHEIRPHSLPENSRRTFGDRFFDGWFR